MSLRYTSWILLALVLLVGPLAGTHLNAALLYGSYLGTFSGDDSAASLLDDLGLHVELLSQVASSTTNNGVLSYVPTEVVYTNDSVNYYAGDWFYAGPAPVDYLAVKAGPNYAVYDYTGGYDPDWPNAGLWDTADLDDAAMVHLTVYTVPRAIPEPTGLVLALTAAGFATLFRRRR